MEEEFNFEKTDEVAFDDGIYILATRRHFLSKSLEYRVALVEQVDKLYGDIVSNTPEPVPQLIKFYFGDKPVFKKEEEATEEALRLHEEVGGTDNGVGVIYAWEDRTFKKIIGD